MIFFDFVGLSKIIIYLCSTILKVIEPTNKKLAANI